MSDNDIETMTAEVQRDLADTMVRVIDELVGLNKRHLDSEVIDIITRSMLQRATELGLALYSARIAAGDDDAEKELDAIFAELEEDYLGDRRN